MKTRVLLLAGILVSMPCIMAMGIVGEKAPRTKAPPTARQFAGIVTDLEGVATHVDQLSYDGELYVPVYRGKGLVVIPFEKILSMDFGEKAEGKRKVSITFTTNDVEAFLIDENVLFVGTVPFGTYQIETRHMKRLEFLAPSSGH